MRLKGKLLKNKHFFNKYGEAYKNIGGFENKYQ
jgi:hypothetical protein